MRRPLSPQFDDRIIAVYRAMYAAFFDEWSSIPAQQRCEVAYEELVRDPIGQVETIYAALGLSGFAGIRPRLQEYLASIDGYERNAHPELPQPIRQRIAREWGRCFEEWGYAR